VQLTRSGGTSEVLAVFAVEDAEGNRRPPLTIGPRDVPWAVGQCSVTRPHGRGILPVDSYRALLRLHDPRVWRAAVAVDASLAEPEPLGGRLRLAEAMVRLEGLRAVLRRSAQPEISAELRAGDGGFLLRLAGPRVRGARDYDVRTPASEILRDFLYPDSLDGPIS
jgi:hypothetical protein